MEYINGTRFLFTTGLKLVYCYYCCMPNEALGWFSLEIPCKIGLCSLGTVEICILGWICCGLIMQPSTACSCRLFALYGYEFRILSFKGLTGRGHILETEMGLFAEYTWPRDTWIYGPCIWALQWVMYLFKYIAWALAYLVSDIAA